MTMQPVKPAQKLKRRDFLKAGALAAVAAPMSHGRARFHRCAAAAWMTASMGSGVSDASSGFGLALMAPPAAACQAPWPRRRGAPMALASATLFGASTPLAKLLLGDGIDPRLLAGLLAVSPLLVYFTNTARPYAITVPATLVAAGLLKNTKEPVKVLGRGEISHALTITVHVLSRSRCVTW